MLVHVKKRKTLAVPANDWPHASPRVVSFPCCDGLSRRYRLMIEFKEQVEIGETKSLSEQQPKHLGSS